MHNISIFHKIIIYYVFEFFYFPFRTGLQEPQYTSQYGYLCALIGHRIFFVQYSNKRCELIGTIYYRKYEEKETLIVNKIIFSIGIPTCSPRLKNYYH